MSTHWYQGGHTYLIVAYLRDVVNAEGWRQLVSVSEGDLVSGSFQGDLCPQEETVPQCVSVQTKIQLKPVKYLTSFTPLQFVFGIALKKTLSSQCQQHNTYGP